MPARAQDIDIADDEDLELDDVEGRLGSFDAFLAEAQADHVDGAETDPSYQLPRVVTSTDLDVADVDDVEGLADDREARRAGRAGCLRGCPRGAAPGEHRRPDRQGACRTTSRSHPTVS